MSKHDYHDPHHGLRETYRDLSVMDQEERAKVRQAGPALLSALKTLVEFARDSRVVDPADYRMAIQNAEDAIASAESRLTTRAIGSER
jgi:hypothetical protein